jgi:hypothetical protein
MRLLPDLFSPTLAKLQRTRASQRQDPTRGLYRRETWNVGRLAHQDVTLKGKNRMASCNLGLKLP